MKHLKTTVGALLLGSATAALAMALLAPARAQLVYNGDNFMDNHGHTVCLCSGTECPFCKNIQ